MFPLGSLIKVSDFKTYEQMSAKSPYLIQGQNLEYLRREGEQYVILVFLNIIFLSQTNVITKCNNITARSYSCGLCADWRYVKIPVSKKIYLDFVYPALSALIMNTGHQICVKLTLAGVAQLMGCHPMYLRIPSQGTCQACGLDP